MAYITRFGFVVAVLLLLASCMKDPELPPGIIDDPITSTTLAKGELVNSQIEMGLRIINELYEKGDPNNNVVVTPFSLGWTTSLLMNGANGITSSGIYQAMQIQNLSPLDVNLIYQDLYNELISADQSATVAFGNGLWMDPSLNLKPAFNTSDNQFYNSQVKSLAFHDGTAATTINQWISDQTSNRIPELLQSIDVNNRLMLINTFFFKSPFVTAFDTAKTHTQFFKLPDGSREPVDMMYMQGVPLKYYEDPLLEITELPYGNGRFNLTIIMPKSSANLDAMIRNATAEDWNNWIAALQPKSDLELQIPRFTIAYNANLDEALASLGMEDAFGDAADFSNMVDGDLVLNDVESGAYLQIIENGTESAPANINPIEGEVQLMQVSKPFIAAVRDSKTGTVLLMAKIVNPNFN